MAKKVEINIGESGDSVSVDVTDRFGRVKTYNWDHHDTHQEFLVTLLNDLGFSVEYEEVY